MNRLFLALLIVCSPCALAHAQSFAHHDRSKPQIIEDATADQVVGARAIFLLKRLDDDVIVYDSLSDFEDRGTVARVPFETFQRDLLEITPELQKLLLNLPDTSLRADLINAFTSYRAGADSWEKISSLRVVNVSQFKSRLTDSTSDACLVGGLPYSVADHWRQANNYLQRAVRDLGLK
jgi:hypothetical protein